MNEGLRADFASEPELLAHLEAAKMQLEDFYEKNYVQQPQPLAAHPRTTTQARSDMFASPQKVDFTLHYQKKDRLIVNEMKEYFKLTSEDFNTCEPLKWWLGR